MKEILFAASLLALASPSFGQGKSGTFTGEIMDRQCALMHSHDNMMKTVNANNAKECAINCVKNGDKFALFDSKAQKIYIIDDQKKVRDYAGQQVTVEGKYDEDTGTLSVKSIKPAQ